MGLVFSLLSHEIKYCLDGKWSPIIASFFLISYLSTQKWVAESLARDINIKYKISVDFLDDSPTKWLVGRENSSKVFLKDKFFSQLLPLHNVQIFIQLYTISNHNKQPKTISR